MHDSSTWLGPLPFALPTSELDALYAQSDFNHETFAEKLKIATGWSGRLPLLQLRGSSSSSQPRVSFIGDSIAEELAASCRLLSPSWGCEVESRAQPCGPTFLKPNCTKTLSHATRFFDRGSDVVVIAFGAHFLLPSLIKDWSSRAHTASTSSLSESERYNAVSSGLAPGLMLAKVWGELLRKALEVAPNGRKTRKALVLCTPMAFDSAMMLGSPWKQDWDRFYQFELAKMWGDHAEATAARLSISRPGLFIAPLTRLARRYRYMRCDGMHFGSFVCSGGGRNASGGQSSVVPCSPYEPSGPEARSSGLVAMRGTVCHPKLGAYHGLLSTLVAAAVGGRTLDEEIARHDDERGASTVDDPRGTWQLPADDFTRYQMEKPLIDALRLARHAYVASSSGRS